MVLEEEAAEISLRPVRQVKEWTFKLILLGDSNVGKTSILRRYANDEIPMGVHKPTIGVDFRSKELQIQEERVRVYIWDTAGQERFKTMTKQYYRGAHGVILVYDVTNPTSFNHVEYWLRDFQKFTDGPIHKILVGNKSDVDDSERKVAPAEGQLLSIELDVPFMETSAKNNTNVSEMFEKIVTDLVVRRKNRSSVSSLSISSSRNSTANASTNAERIVLSYKDKSKLKKAYNKCCIE